MTFHGAAKQARFRLLLTCCIVLHGIVLYCIVLYCIALYCFKFHFRRRYSHWISTIYLLRKLQIIPLSHFFISVTIQIVQICRIINQFNFLIHL